MIKTIIHFIDIKERLILGISLASIPILPILGIVATLSTIVFNAIRIYKEIKSKK